MFIDIWHNVLWSKYKGDVFSELWHSVDRNQFRLQFTQIAETDADRAALSAVEVSRHRYPYDLLFKGSFQNTNFRMRARAILPRMLRSRADLTILSCYERLDCWLQLFVLVLRRKKVALFLDSTINDRRQTFVNGLLKRFFFQTVDGIFGYGTRTKEYAVHYGARPEKVFIPCQAAAIPDGYTPENALRQRLAADISPAAPRFLFVGRLSSEKSIDTLIDAFAAVLPHLPAATLVLVGDGPQRAALEARSKARDIGKSVSFAGSKSGQELYSEFTRASVLILPSVSEPWGLVVNEALAHGCPAIVSDRCGCVPELIVEGKTGLVHRARDVSDLAAKLLAAPALFANLERTARDCLALMSLYTPERVADRIMGGCKQILGLTDAPVKHVIG